MPLLRAQACPHSLLLQGAFEMMTVSTMKVRKYVNHCAAHTWLFVVGKLAVVLLVPRDAQSLKSMVAQ